MLDGLLEYHMWAEVWVELWNVFLQLPRQPCMEDQKAQGIIQKLRDDCVAKRTVCTSARAQGWAGIASTA